MRNRGKCAYLDQAGRIYSFTHSSGAGCFCNINMLKCKPMVEIRPPVVGIFGHIDHGKSTLLDYIRKSNITGKEVGGITQHMGAYEVIHRKDDGPEAKITFLDTPGHAAFESIRTKGASAADIAVLVVSAEDGVKPQTLEALNQIKAAGIPFIVAITKIDKSSADIDRTKQSLAENNVFVEGYGGNVPVVALSSKTGQGVDELLETLLLMAELENFTAERDENGYGIIIESKLDPKQGILATGIIKSGTVRRGMIAGSRGTIAPLRFILDAEGNNVEELSFSSPIQIIGWEKMPATGTTFRTFLKKDEALSYATAEAEAAPSILRSKIAAGMTAVPVILKADTVGSLDAIFHELEKLSFERIAPQVVLSGVGAINENDVKLALTAPGTIVIGFNARVDAPAAAIAERNSIPIHVFSIIYELSEKIASILTEREPKIEVEETIGRAKVLKNFSSTKDKQVLGGKVLEGRLEKGAVVKIIRREAELGIGKVKELQQAKVAIDSVSEENEFGAMVESKIEIAPNDILLAVVKVTK
jgi:translation initiation factor IF-2